MTLWAVFRASSSFASASLSRASAAAGSSRAQARNRSALRQVLFHGQSCPLLVVFMFEALAGRAKVDDSQQHEDERLNETDEDDVEALPYEKDQGTDDGRPDGAHHWQLKS